MNILDFDRWVIAIKEGFKADINDDKENENEKDELQVEAPNEGNDITYVVNGNDVKIKEKITVKNNDNETVDQKFKTTDVDEIKLKKDVIDAVDSINNIKERERSKEIYRLTGGDDTSVKRQIIEIIDNGKSKLMRRKTTNDKGESVEISLYNSLTRVWDKKGEYEYLDISDSSYKPNQENNLEIDLDVKTMYNITSVKSVGRGEYLLPLLFNDVYKQQVFGQEKYDYDKFSIGDNFIIKNGDDTLPINNDNKYHLELKAPNASLSFLKNNLTKNDKGHYKKCEGENDENYKNAIATSFLNYAKRQNKNRKNLFFCIFCEDENKALIGILFINVSNITDEDLISNDENDTSILEKFKELIQIDIDNKITSESEKNKFRYSLTYEKGKPIIKCRIHENYFINESTIFSRDNFINEIYKK